MGPSGLAAHCIMVHRESLKTFREGAGRRAPTGSVGMWPPLVPGPLRDGADGCSVRTTQVLQGMRLAGRSMASRHQGGGTRTGLRVNVEESRQGPRASLILVDDHRMFVEMLRQSLDWSYDIAAVAYRADELLALLGTTPADGLLLDLQLPDRSGVGLIAQVRRVRPALRILVLTMFRDRAVAEAAFAAGADGFLPKNAGCDELEAALAAVLAGRRYLSPLVPKTSHRTGLAALHPMLQGLTRRQEEVLTLLAEGVHEGAIARRLGLSTSGVTFHKHNLQRILGLETDRALLGYAMLLHECLAEHRPEHPEAGGGGEKASHRANRTRVALVDRPERRGKKGAAACTAW